MDHGLWVNPGRPPTRLGGDGIAPYLLVPHWVSAHVAEFLAEHGVELEIRDLIGREPQANPGPDEPIRLQIRNMPAEVVQQFLDGYEPPPSPRGR